MRWRTDRIKFAPAVAAAAAMAFSAGAQTPLKVCPDPSSPCKSRHKTFEKYELSFTLPKAIKPNVTYSSAPFYAVILKTIAEPDCDQGEYSSATERFRAQAQKLFPDRKVFAENQCPDMGAVGYSINGKPNTKAFVAVYAGETQLEADLVLGKAKGKYPAAKVAKMRASFEQIEQ
jgi:hypothetical protein